MVLILVIGFLSCLHQHHDENSELVTSSRSKANFVRMFHNKFTNVDLYLACITMYELKSYDKKNLFTRNDEFIDIASKIQVAGISDENADSLVESFVTTHSDVNFFGDKLLFSINSFLKNYDLIELIFSSVDSDDESENMDTVSNKIGKLKDVNEIYLIYMKVDPI